MSSFLLSDFPRPVRLSEYQSFTDRLLEKTMSVDGILAVYGIGSVSAPGISDLDFVAVFRNDTTVLEDSRQTLNGNEKYMLIHSLYGASAEQFLAAQSFSFFQPYRFLAGKEQLPSQLPVADPAIRDQVALEYLLKFYISLKLQHAYKLIRVRSVLLNAKGAMIDLHHLAPDHPEREKFADELTNIRADWFKGNPPLDAFRSWYHRFSNWFFLFVEEKFRQLPFYIPEVRSYRMSRNLFIHNGPRLQATGKGMTFPILYPLLGNRYFKVLNRINRLEVTLPMQRDNVPAVMLDYFRFNTEHRAYNRLHLPHYLPLTSSLHLQ